MSAPSLVTIDIECLNNSIPHLFRLDVIRSYLEQMNLESTAFNGFILKLLSFILSHNAFIFDGIPLLQVQGVAMGTPCDPSYVNLYLGGWEQNLLANDNLVMYLC